MCGLLAHVVQEEIKCQKKQLDVCGMVKADVLINDVNCPDFLAFSVYDTKAVHYLSMVSEEL